MAVATRALGDAQYGVVATIGSFMALMIFGDLGIGNAFMTSLAKAHAKGDIQAPQTLVSTAWFFLLGAAGVVLLLGVLASLFLPWPRLLGAPDLPASQLQLAVFAVFAVFAVGMPGSMGQRVMMSLQRGAAANTWAVVASILTPGAVALTWVVNAPLWGFVLSTVGVPVAVAAVQTAWVLRRTYPELRPTRVHVTATTTRSLLRVGGLYFVLSLASAIAFQTDSLIVASIQGATAAGVYAVVIRLFRMVGGLAAIGTQQLWTVATAALATGDIDWLRSRMFRVLALTSGVIGIACVIMVVIGRPLVRFWAGAGLVPPLSLLVWMAVSTVYFNAASQVVFLLNAADVVRPQVAMALAMAAANVSLSIYLTQRFGVIGPVVGSLVAHVVCYGVPALFIARRILRS